MKTSVKIFSALATEVLERNINEWLSGGGWEIKDIKVFSDNHAFYALIIYLR